MVCYLIPEGGCLSPDKIFYYFVVVVKEKICLESGQRKKQRPVEETRGTPSVRNICAHVFDVTSHLFSSCSLLLPPIPGDREVQGDGVPDHQLRRDGVQGVDRERGGSHHRKP